MTATPNPMDRIAAMEKQMQLMVKKHNDLDAKHKKLAQEHAATKKALGELQASHRQLASGQVKLKQQVDQTPH